jgi:hypothetical protein
MQNIYFAARCADANKMVIKGKLPDHLANLGGHRAPISGSTPHNGSAGAQPGSSASGSGAAQTAGKRAREADDEAARPLTQKEKEERAQRDAARQRVQARTASAFGLG